MERSLKMLLWLLGFTCRHRRITWMFADEQGTYVRCLNCGRRLPRQIEDPIRRAA